ncbi:MAG: formylmethanofuran dehydrogenase subunit C [Planctomycetes bacterium]|nr:formylmethanofuran dehydrogenase subunit C [Planctomycetota bacterium]
MSIALHLKRQPTVPLEAETISPDRLADLSNSEIRSLTVYHGKRQLPLGEFFDVEGERSDELHLHGELHKVRWIGRAMSRGSIVVHGSAGMHLGAYMRGGRIEVHGNAGDWLGAEMKNGFIHVHGNAGGQIGAAYRGSLSGMKNGMILVDGSAGLEVGMRMRRGMIILGGPARDFTGLQMKGGTIILLSGAEIRTGAWMNRGVIISLKPLRMMPTFARASDAIPTFVHLYARHLKQYGVTLPCSPAEGAYRVYSGDLSIPGKGEILVWQPADVDMPLHTQVVSCKGVRQ